MSNDTVLDENDHADGIDRRGFLKCMAWAGTGVVWTLSAGILHTGDVSHTSMPAQYDAVDQIFKGAKFSQDQVYYVPGEHDTFVDNGKAHLDRFGQCSATGWRSFDF